MEIKLNVTQTIWRYINARERFFEAVSLGKIRIDWSELLTMNFGKLNHDEYKALSKLMWEASYTDRYAIAKYVFMRFGHTKKCLDFLSSIIPAQYKHKYVYFMYSRSIDRYYPNIENSKDYRMMDGICANYMTESGDMKWMYWDLVKGISCGILVKYHGEES